MIRTPNDIVEDLIKSLEKMIDAQDDMWEEEKYSNYRETQKIRLEKLIPAKEEFKSFLDEYMDSRIDNYVQKHGIKRSYFSETHLLD